MNDNHTDYSVLEERTYYRVIIPSVVFVGIIIFSFYNGENKDVVSHISLVSSISSIILAVLAIIYSYYLNNSQKIDSNNLRDQISKLSEVVEKINISNDKLVKVDGMIDKLELTSKRIEELHEKFDSIKNIIEMKGSKEIFPDKPEEEIKYKDHSKETDKKVAKDDINDGNSNKPNMKGE